MQLLIDTQLCSKCNTCATVCLVKIIERATDTTVPHIPVEKADFCLQCGHCESFCPERALTLDYLTEEKAEHRLPAATADPNDLAAFMTMRRSIRHFKSKKVPKELILKSLEVARYAPPVWHWYLLGRLCHPGSRRIPTPEGLPGPPGRSSLCCCSPARLLSVSHYGDSSAQPVGGELETSVWGCVENKQK